MQGISLLYIVTSILVCGNVTSGAFMRVCISVTEKNVDCKETAVNYDDLRAPPKTSSTDKNDNMKKDNSLLEDAPTETEENENRLDEDPARSNALDNSLADSSYRMKRQDTSCDHVYVYNKIGNMSPLCTLIKDLIANEKKKSDETTTSASPDEKTNAPDSTETTMADTTDMITLTPPKRTYVSDNKAGYVSPGVAVAIALLSFLLGLILYSAMFCRLCVPKMRLLKAKKIPYQKRPDIIVNASNGTVVADINIEMDDPVYRGSEENAPAVISQPGITYEQLLNGENNDDTYNVIEDTKYNTHTANTNPEDHYAAIDNPNNQTNSMEPTEKQPHSNAADALDEPSDERHHYFVLEKDNDKVQLLPSVEKENDVVSQSDKNQIQDPPKEPIEQHSYFILEKTSVNDSNNSSMDQQNNLTFENEAENKPPQPPTEEHSYFVLEKSVDEHFVDNI